MGQAPPYEVIPSQNEVNVFMDTKMFTRGLPHELIPYTYCMFLLYILLWLPGGIGYWLDRRRQGLLALRWGDTRFGRRSGDVRF